MVCAANQCVQSLLKEGPCHSSDGWLLSHRGGLVMWDLWCTKWQWVTFSPSTSVSPANYSIECFTLIIIHHPGLVKYYYYLIDLEMGQ
jgi:hypothetical protein